jgi:hypothetical protein
MSERIRRAVKALYDGEYPAPHCDAILNEIERLTERERVLREALRESSYLLHVYGPDSCSRWQAGLGDCGACEACRVFRAQDKSEDALAQTESNKPASAGKDNTCTPPPDAVE